MSFQIDQTQGQRKCDVFKALKKFNYKSVRADIIDVIKKNRNCSEKEARDIKVLRPSEVTEVLQRYA